MALLAVVLLALGSAGPRSPTLLKLACAAHLRETGHTIADIVAKTGITRPAWTGTCRLGRRGADRSAEVGQPWPM